MSFDHPSQLPPPFKSKKIGTNETHFILSSNGTLNILVKDLQPKLLKSLGRSILNFVLFWHSDQSDKIALGVVTIFDFYSKVWGFYYRKKSQGKFDVIFGKSENQHYPEKIERYFLLYRTAGLFSQAVSRRRKESRKFPLFISFPRQFYRAIS